MTVEQLRDELDRLCKLGRGHLPARVAITTITDFEHENGDTASKTETEYQNVVEVSESNGVDGPWMAVEGRR